MPRLVSSDYAKNFPLLANHDFNGTLYLPGHTTLLTPDIDDKFEEVVFVNGRLAIFPEVRNLFRDKGKFSVIELEEKIKQNEILKEILESREKIAVPPHYFALQQFEDEGIAWCKTNVNPRRPIFFNEDTFYPGSIYWEIRVKTHQ